VKKSQTIKEQLTDVKRWITRLEHRWAETAEAVDELRKRLDNLPAVVAAAAIVPWHALEQSDRRSEAANLAPWVTWLVNAYDLSDRWPGCWFQHEGLVETLRALRRWHAALTTELAADPKAATNWHDALFRTVDKNLQPVTHRCLTSHRESEPFVSTVRWADKATGSGAGGIASDLPSGSSL